MRNPYDTIGRIGLFLAIVGAINWLLVGLFEWNLAAWLFTDSGTQTVSSMGERIVYIVIGAGGVLAIPMLAATLARASGRSMEGARDSAADHADADDTDYYLGASKSEREASRESQPARVAETEPLRAQESQADEMRQSPPIRKTEKVIIRTEEPITETAGVASTSAADSPSSAADSSSSTADSSSSAADRPSSADEHLRYGTVEETDEGLDQDLDDGRKENRRAA